MSAHSTGLEGGMIMRAAIPSENVIQASFASRATLQPEKIIGIKICFQNYHAGRNCYKRFPWDIIFC